MLILLWLAAGLVLGCVYVMYARSARYPMLCAPFDLLVAAFIAVAVTGSVSSGESRQQ